MNDVQAPEVQAGNVFHGDVSTGESGTVNAFGGDQHNHHGDEHNYYLSVSALRRRIRYASDPGRLDRELRLVVPPPGLDQDLNALRETRLLVLAGGSRSGLSTAARQRWRAFAAEKPGRASEELFVSDHDELIDELGDLKRPSVLLLDISHDLDLATRAAERFPQVLAALHERDSFLVVAVGEAGRAAAERAARGSVHRVDRPDPIAVMAARMRRKDLLEKMERDTAFSDLVVKLWPPQAVQVAELLDAASPESGHDALITLVKSCLNSWEDQLADLFENRLTTGSARALVLATSAFAGADRDSIAFAAKDLAEVAGEASNPSVLVDPSLKKQFEPLESMLTPESGSFTSRGLGEGVLPFAWKQFPTWRTPIRTWLDRLLRSQQLADDTLAVLLPRLLTFAGATGVADLVTEPAATIAGEGSGSKIRRELAAGLLVAGALDPTVGQQVRRQLWQWSYHRAGVPVALQRTVAQVCGETEYATRFPRNALTRLKHLLKSDIPAVAEGAIEALAAAAGSLPPQTVVEHLAEWAAQRGDARLRAITPTVMLVLLDDDRVRATWSCDWIARDPSGTVASMWRAVFTHASPGVVRDTVAEWLAFAAEARPERRAALADRLAIAATGNFWTLGQLSQAVSQRAWAERDADGDVLALRDRLASHLSQAKVAM